MANESTESILSFLENLKLADKYHDIFIQNGFMTVGDCHGITEETLKRIGVTLPGHYRRILSKLPGCSVKKPPRRVSSSNDASKISEDLFVQNKDEVLVNEDEEEGVYAEMGSVNIVSINSDSSDPRASEHSVPIKPPRTPENLRKMKKFSSFPDRIDSIFMPAISAATAHSLEDLTEISPSSSDKVFSSPIKQNKDVYDNFHSSSKSINSCDTYSSLDVQNAPLPLPPPWLTTPENMQDDLPLPPPMESLDGSIKTSVVADSYDSISLRLPQQSKTHPTSKEVSANSSIDNSDIYDCVPTDSNFPEAPQPDTLSKTSIDFQTAPQRVGNYEEICLQNNFAQNISGKHDESVFMNVGTSAFSNQNSRTVSLGDSTYQTASDLSNEMLDVDVEPRLQLLSTGENKGAQDPSVKRSKSFDIYDTSSDLDTTMNCSSENVYEVAETKTENFGVEKIARTNSRNSSTLPRSSGSLPASTLLRNVNRSPLKLLRRGQPSIKQTNDSAICSDVSSDVDIYQNTEDFKETNETIYQDIGLPKENMEFNADKAKKLTTPNKAWPGKTKFRLNQSKRARPVSVMVNFKDNHHNVLSSSEESVDNVGKHTPGAHQRAVSYSDGKFASAFGNSLSIRDCNQPDPGLDMQLAQKASKKGWLYKHGGHDGRAPQRKRWVVFDGEELIYYESDTKMDVSKGIIPVGVIEKVEADPSDSKVFHITTKGKRKYIFNAETTEDKLFWMRTLNVGIMVNEKKCQGQYRPGGTMCMPYKEGLLKLDGNRQKNYFATKGDQFAYYKSNNEFQFGQPIARLSMKIATVKELDRKRWQIVFPFRTFTLAAESEEEKRAWVEALNDAIAEGLSDYKVVQEIWSLPQNQKCADCGKDDPDWASINLAIVICKHCAGVHRDLGVHNSKVRSLKMDVKIWNDTIKNMLLLLGNSAANSFWSAKLKTSEAITDMVDKKQRAWHITSKYIEMRYLELHRFSGDQELLNLELIEAVRRNDLPEAYKLVFSGADPNCATGKEHGKTPHLLAKHLGYNVLAEFLSQNGATDVISPQGHVTDRSNCVLKKDTLPQTSRVKPPLLLKDHLYKYGGDFKNQMDEKKGRILDFNVRRPGEFQKRWCVLENNVFKYYDPERVNVAKDEIDCSDLLSIGMCQPEQATKAGYQFAFEVGRNTGRTYLFCSERKETLFNWLNGLMQAIVPPHVQNSMKNESGFDRIGKMWMKTQSWAKKSSEWRQTWCKLKGKQLSYFHQETISMETIDLKRLVQIGLDLSQDGSGSTTPTSKEPSITFMLVFRDKSYYFRSDTKADSETWLAALKKADSNTADKLHEQQQTGEGVPIILEKCTTFIEQFGLTTKGIYRLSGTHSKTTNLLSNFCQNARETQMRDSELNVHDVANALKRWFKSLPGSLMTEELHDEWIAAAQLKPEQQKQKMVCYKQLIEKLPTINRLTLKVLLCHLNNVASHSKENEMSAHNLAIVFGPTLLEYGTDGNNQFFSETSQEIGCVEDLLQFYDWLFDVTAVDREKERLMLEAKEKITMASQQQNMLTTLDYDMMVPIYLNSKEDKCVNYKVNMNAGELIARICKTHNFTRQTLGLFEVIADGGAERPLHHTEHVLSVIKSWEMPSTNYLLAKHDYVRDKIRWLEQQNITIGDKLFENELRHYDPKKKWIKVLASLKQSDTGLIMSFYKSPENASVLDVAASNWRKRSMKVPVLTRRTGGNPDAKNIFNISLSLYNIYIGTDKHKSGKLPSSCNAGFILASQSEPTKYFAVDTEISLYRWFGKIVAYKFPEGFSPPDTPDFLSEDEHPTFRRNVEETSTRRVMKPTISQGDIGEAVKKLALQRFPSTGSDDASRENIYEAAAPFGNAQNSKSNQSSPISPRPTSIFPQSPLLGGRQPFLSPSEPQNLGGIFNMKLQSELSSVLRKRTEQ